MDSLKRTAIRQEVAKQLDMQREGLLETLFQGCGEKDTPEKIYSRMIINGVYASVTLAAEMAIGILLESGEVTPRSDDELRRSIFSVCSGKDERKIYGKERMLSMAEMKEMNVRNGEKPQIEEIKAENHVWLTKVTFSGGESITVSGNDISIFDRFVAAGEELEALADEMEKSESNSEERDIKESIEERKHFSEKATEIMDGVFGEGATRKFFGDVYAAIPNFQPDLEAFVDFWNALIPVAERLVDHKVKLEKLASKKRMSKYQPQDHQKPSARK